MVRSNTFARGMTRAHAQTWLATGVYSTYCRFSSTNASNVPPPQTAHEASKQYRCISIFSVKRNGSRVGNVFANVSNLKGQTPIKFPSGLVQKKRIKKQIKSNAIAKLIIEKISFFIRSNFGCAKVIIKGHNSRNKSLSYLKELKRKKLLNK